MDENTKIIVKLADNTQFEATPDGCGNLLIDDSIEESVFSADNLSKVVMTEDGHEHTYTEQVLRAYYAFDAGRVLIRISDMTDVERLENTNAMLEECILEMSEIIYA